MHSPITTLIVIALVSTVSVGGLILGVWYLYVYIRHNFRTRDPSLPAYVRYSVNGEEKVPTRLKLARFFNLGRPVAEGTWLYNLQEKLDKRHLRVRQQLHVIFSHS
jgi:hypothetical protein